MRHNKIVLIIKIPRQNK